MQKDERWRGRAGSGEDHREPLLARPSRMPQHTSLVSCEAGGLHRYPSASHSSVSSMTAILFIHVRMSQQESTLLRHDTLTGRPQRRQSLAGDCPHLPASSSSCSTTSLQH
eukprot:scaffold7519_cov417-Prasinococcus_capsulatus_cf.AAC.2